MYEVHAGWSRPQFMARQSISAGRSRSAELANARIFCLRHLLRLKFAADSQRMMENVHCSTRLRGCGLAVSFHVERSP
jgi:hypothetical protein